MAGYSSDPGIPSNTTTDKPLENNCSTSDQRPDIPGYEISEVLAYSDHSIVYRASDKSLGKEVAIKVPRLFGPEAQTFSVFVGSAKIQAQLRHPGIPPVFHLGTLSDGRPYQVMNLVHGESLSTLLTERINPVTDRIRFLSVFEQLCQAIAYAHAHHVLHGNLNPQHVLIGQFGEVQVIGWRLAAILSRETSEPINRPPFTMPTGFPAYMAPECFRGEWETVDARSDVFALGGILLGILTGHPPYVGEVALEKIKKASAGDLSEAYRRLDCCGEDADLIAIAKRCLNSNSADRPGNAGELAEIISAYRNRVSERVRKSEADRLAAESLEVEKGKRRHLQAALVLVVGLFLIWTVALMWWQNKQATVRRILDGAREQDDKKTEQLLERDRAAAERRARELQERMILQKQIRERLERERAEKQKQMLDDGRTAPPPREVKRP